MKSIMSISVALLLCCQVCSAQNHGSRIAPSGETRVTATLGKIRLQAIFRTSIVQVTNTDENNRRFVQCTYSRFPCSLTDQIRVLVDAKEVFVPRSAYADLGDIVTAEWTMERGQVELVIKGGDASESYIARLVLSKGKVSERRVYSGEDPTRPLEIDHYYSG